MARTSPLEPNARLRCLIVQAGCTYDALARSVNTLGATAQDPPLRLRYDRSSVAHWVQGMRPREPVPLLVAEALSRRLGRTVDVAETGLRPPSTHPGDGDALAWIASTGHAELSAPWDRATTPVYTVLRLRELLPGAGVSVPSLLPARADTRSVGASEARALEEAVEFFATQNAAFEGRYTMLAAVSFLTHDAGRWLDMPARESVRTRLLRATAMLGFVVSRMHLGRGDDAWAQRYLIGAVRAAREAEDPVLDALCLRALGTQALSVGQFGIGCDLVEAAVAVGLRRAGPAQAAYLLAQWAFVQARRGERAAAIRSLARAESLQSSGAGDEGLFARYPPAALAYQRGLTMAAVGDRDGAIAVLRCSLAERDPRSHRARAITFQRLIALESRVGDLDVACAHGDSALRELPHLHPRVASRILSAMRGSMGPRGADPIVAGFLRRVDATVATQAAARSCQGSGASA